jgi:acetoin:2,6-dichlorophenolindophenol oxidoreductase subunit beta
MSTRIDELMVLLRERPASRASSAGDAPSPGICAVPRELSYAQAIQEAMAIAMEADERVFLMGEDIGVYGGAFQVTGDLVQRFGTERVMDTPISELGAAGVAIGAALTGLRPIFEFQFSDFSALAMEQIVNQAAKLRFMLGGAVSVPLVMRFPSGSGTGAAAQHSQSLEAWFAHVPGLKVVQPATPHDAKGCLLAAIADPDPVMIFEHKLLYKMKGEVPEGHYVVPLGKARLCRPGRDVTIVATSIMVHRALAAAEALAREGIEAEVIDLRSLRPLDREALTQSVKRTHRLVCVYEGVKTLGIGAELSASIAESDAFDYLDAPILRLGGAECPIPYNPELEKAAVPQTPSIIAAVRDLVRGKL